MTISRWTFTSWWRHRFSSFNNPKVKFLGITGVYRPDIFLVTQSPVSKHSRKLALHTHKSAYWPSGLCPGLPGWAATRTNLDFTEARDNEWQWHHMGHMQICTSPQIANYASTPPLSSLQAGCPSCHPINSVKALKSSTVRSNHLFLDQSLYLKNFNLCGRGADLHIAQLIPLPLTVSCFSKIHIGFTTVLTFLVPAHTDSLRQAAVKQVLLLY